MPNGFLSVGLLELYIFFFLDFCIISLRYYFCYEYIFWLSFVFCFSLRTVRFFVRVLERKTRGKEKQKKGMGEEEGKGMDEEAKRKRIFSGRRGKQRKKRNERENYKQNIKKDIFWGDKQVSRLGNIHSCLQLMNMIVGGSNFYSMKVITDEL